MARRTTEGEVTAESHPRVSHPARLPLVGRSRELAHVVKEFDRAATSSSCRRCTIVGAPGSGKSRLITEVEASADPAVSILHAQCRSHDEVSVFQPLVAAIEEAASITREDDPL